MKCDCGRSIKLKEGVYGDWFIDCACGIHYKMVAHESIDLPLKFDSVDKIAEISFKTNPIIRDACVVK